MSSLVKISNKTDNVLGSSRPPNEEGADLPPPLKSYFARDISLKNHFCVILQSIQNFFGPDIPRILSGALRSGQKCTQEEPEMTVSAGMKI